MSNDGAHCLVSQRPNQTQCVLHQIQEAKRRKIPFVAVVPAACFPVSALVGCDHMKTGSSERQHDFSPTVGQFREAVKQ